MQFCKEMNYDGRLGGLTLLLPESCISLIMSYQICTFSLPVPQRALLTFQESQFCAASDNYISALGKKSTAVSTNRIVPITNILCIGIFNGKKNKKKKLKFWP
jgi:hypothetical protein